MKVNMTIRGSASIDKRFTQEESFGKFMKDIIDELNAKGFKMNLEIDYSDANLDENGTLFIHDNEFVDQLRLPLQFDEQKKRGYYDGKDERKLEGRI